MAESMDRPVSLTTHDRTPEAVDVRWSRTAARGPFHGAFFPGAEEASIFPLLSRMAPEAQRAVRILIDPAGWTLVLLTGEWEEAPTAWPLHRIGAGPFVFHPADVEPMPPLSPRWAAGRDPEAHLLGRVENGRVEWMRWSEQAALLPVDLLRLEPTVRPFARRASAALEPPLREFPSFLSEQLPKASGFEGEEQRRLAGVPDPKPSFWSRLLGRNQPPSAIEWKNLLRPPQSSIGGAIRSFFSNLGGGSPGSDATVSPGFLRRLFDRQSSMFDRLAKLFERGDLDSALKHSIPIDNDLVTSMKQRGLISMSWQLPENLVDYSFNRLNRGGSGPAVLGSSDHLARLTLLYRRAAEKLSRDGKHRQAAYVYAHLLKDYAKAARELETGGFHLEAATLLKEKLRSKLAAAQVLERGGYAPEAVALYLEERAFETAVALCDRAQMTEESQRCLGLWLEDLKSRGLRLQAGDLLRDRMARPAEARTLYQAELAAPGGMRGDAGARLVDLEYAEGRREFQEWSRCEGFLRSELEDGNRFKDHVVQLSKFHRAVRQWLRSHPVGPDQHKFLLRKTRQSLMHAVRESQVRKQEAVRGDVVADLSEILEETGDPLAVQDVRKGLTISAAPAARVRPYRRLIGGIRPIANGRYFCWARDQWAWMDASGGARTPPRRLPSLPQSLAVHPVPEADGSLAAGMITHDHRLTLMRFSRGQVEVTAIRPMPGALSIVAERTPPGFLIGTSDGSLYRTAPVASRRPSLSRYREGANDDSFQFLDWWGTEPILLCAGRLPQVSLCLVTENAQDFREWSVPSTIGSLERMVVQDSAVFCYGKEARFGMVLGSRGQVAAVEAPDLPVVGVTALGFTDRNQVAIGYQDGRIGVADFDADSPETTGLRLRSMFRTSLSAVVAIQGLPFGRAMVLDAEFKCAVLDTRGLSLVQEGAWEQV
jgi:hypothetical protein